MKRFMRNAAVAALALATVGAVATAASAQSYGRLVVFGDSLSDNGNLPAPLGPTSPPYFNNRFSNGPVFSERLGFTLARVGGSVTGSINYAYGGARTDLQTLPPSLQNQLAAYRGAGGVFGRNDLVIAWGGANNLLQGIPVAAANPATAQATITPIATNAAADMGLIVRTIAGLGAGTVLVPNIPRLAPTPQISGAGASAQQLGDYAASTFNTALSAQLFAAAGANPNSNIILMDVFRAGDTIAAIAGFYGITNTTQACFNGVTVCANPNSYFYFDGVHPTATGHQILANLATDYLYYGDRGAQATLLGETGYRHREDALDAAAEDMSAGREWAPGATLTFSVIGDDVEMDARGSVEAADARGWGGRVALDQTLSPSFRFGLAASFRDTEVDGRSFDFDAKSFGVDASVGWRLGSGFVNGTLGGSVDTYDGIERTTALLPVVHTAKSDGRSFGARVQGGWWLDAGGFALSPRAGVSWIKTDVEDFSESGAAAQYSYAARSVELVTADVALRGEGRLGGLKAVGEVGYRAELEDRSDAVRTGIVANPAQVLARTVANPFGDHVTAELGFETGFLGGQLGLGYQGRFGDQANSHAGAITWTLPIQ